MTFDPSRFAVLPFPDLENKLDYAVPSEGSGLWEWWDYYNTCGLVTVPLNGERRPMERWVHYRDDDPTGLGAYDADTRRWLDEGVWWQAAGIGVLCEFSNAICLDVDIPEAEAWPHLAASFGVPIAPEQHPHGVVLTRSNRLHLWFGVPDGVAVPSIGVSEMSDLGYTNIELKARGSCVPLPPSESGGGLYQWRRPPRMLRPDVFNIFDPIPDWLAST